MSAALALQGALLSALRSDTPLAALASGGIHDGAPSGARFPHVSLGELVSLDWDTATEEGAEHYATLFVWSRAGGRRATLEILAAIVAVLDEATLAVAGQRLVNLRVEATDARREADGRTWRGRARLRAVTEPA